MKVRDTRRPGFLWLDNEIIDDYAADLGSTALLVYIYLCRRSDNKTAQCWPTQDTLAEFCKVSKRSIKTAIALLKVKNLIAVEVEKVEGSQYPSNIYTLLDVKTGGKNLPLVSKTGGSQEPKPGEATAPLTRPIELDPSLSVPSVPTGDSFQLNGDDHPQKKKTGDPRHAPFKKQLIKYWEHVNPELPGYQWDAGDAGQLATFLRKWPTLTLRELHGWLENYRDSQGIVTTKTPKQFLPLLHEYAIQPLDQYRKPIQEKHVYP